MLEGLLAIAYADKMMQDGYMVTKDCYRRWYMAVDLCHYHDFECCSHLRYLLWNF